MFQHTCPTLGRASRSTCAVFFFPKSVSHYQRRPTGTATSQWAATGSSGSKSAAFPFRACMTPTPASLCTYMIRRSCMHRCIRYRWFAPGLEITLKVTHVAGDLGPTDLKVCLCRCICMGLQHPHSWSLPCTICTSTATVPPMASFGTCLTAPFHNIHVLLSNTPKPPGPSQSAGAMPSCSLCTTRPVRPLETCSTSSTSPPIATATPGLWCVHGLHQLLFTVEHSRSTTSKSSSTKPMTRYAFGKHSFCVSATPAPSGTTRSSECHKTSGGSGSRRSNMYV